MPHYSMVLATLGLVASFISQTTGQAAQKRSASDEFTTVSVFLHIPAPDMVQQLDTELARRGGWTRCQDHAKQDTCWFYSASDGDLLAWGGPASNGGGHYMLGFSPKKPLPLEPTVLASLIARARNVEAKGDSLLISLSESTTPIGVKISTTMTVILPAGLWKMSVSKADWAK